MKKLSEHEDPPLTDAARLAEMIAGDFYCARFDLSARDLVSGNTWSQMPEVEYVQKLRASGASDRMVRLFLTFISAMDRARDAVRLWRAGARLFESRPELFDPVEVKDMQLEELLPLLSASGVSQRHKADTGAWLGIARSLAAGSGPVCRVIDQGSGDAKELLEDLQSRDHAGLPRFPMLRGPKIGPMWVRMVAEPGGARIDRMDTIPVAVDVQVRRATENLGVTDTRGLPLKAATKWVIQSAWHVAVAGAKIDGPSGITGTCAALDPALWFFGKYGCSHCEKVGKRVPIGRACGYCQLPVPTPTRAGE